MRSRRHRPFYRLSIAILAILILAVAQVIGYEVLSLSKEMAKGNLLGEWMDFGIIFACLIVIFLLIWGIFGLSKKKYRRSSER